MDGAETGCEECARTCCFVHRTDLSPAVSVTSFFKIMIGEDFSRVLYHVVVITKSDLCIICKSIYAALLQFVPPKFACAVRALVGQETILEDSCGQTWEVMISKIDGSVVFQRGWSNFASDHDLVVGDLVLFFQTRESHFLVKIYDRTACEKLNFSERSSGRKRKRDILSSEGNDSTSCKTNKSSIDKKCSSASFRTDHEVNGVVKGPISLQNTTNRNGLSEKSDSVSKAEYVNEMECMINLDSGETLREERMCVLDLSAFEVPTVAEERIPQVNDDGVAKERASEVVLSDAFNHDKSESVSDKDSSILSRPRHSTTCAPEEDGGNVSTMLKNEVIKECQIEKNHVSLSQKCGLDNDNGQSANKAISGNSGASSISISVLTKPCQSVETTKVNKEEPIEIKPSLCGQESIKELQEESSKATNARRVSLSVKEKGEVHPVVKTEVIDMVDGFSMTTNRRHFSPLLATCSQSFVELPDRFPFPVIKGMANVEKKMVILRDQAKRLWPVMYHDKHSLQFLATGWEAFSKANCINSGDQCLFNVEDESDGIYSVSIVQR